VVGIEFCYAHGNVDSEHCEHWVRSDRLEVYTYRIFLRTLIVTQLFKKLLAFMNPKVQEEIKRRLNSGNACYHSV
jgi:hypothetical protein